MSTIITVESLNTPSEKNTDEQSLTKAHTGRILEAKRSQQNHINIQKMVS